MTTKNNGSTIIWSIGVIPVQNWISQARRSRDLRFGSLYLSHVIARTINSILKLPNADVVLPRTANGSGLKDQRLLKFGVSVTDLLKDAAKFHYSLPNRATGTLSGLSLDEAETAFQALEVDCLNEAWTELTETVTQPESLAPVCKDTTLRRQIGDAIRASGQPLQLIWCLKEVTLPNNDRDSEAIKIGKELYAAVKRARPIAPADKGAPVGKCRNCGEREAMAPATTDELWSKWRAFQAKLAKDPNIAGGLRFNALPMCSVCGAKRLGGYLGDTAFPSTASIASANWKAKAGEHAPNELEALEKAIREIPGYGKANADIAPLYYQREAQKLRQVQEDQNVLKQIETVEQAQHTLYAALGKSLNQDSPAKPSAYLMSLVFDADDMGKIIGSQHLRIAKSVDEFVENLPKILDKYDATDFYFGGDEGLLLAPVDHAHALPAAIRKKWAQVFDGTPTLSAGVCVFDFGQPLGRALESTHEAIAKAKMQDKKNSLSVTVQMASGSQWNVVSSWDKSWKRIAGAQSALLCGFLATGWPYSVQQMIRGLRADQITINPDQQAAAQQEVRRLTMRSQISKDLKGRLFNDVWEQDLLGDEWFVGQKKLETQNLIYQLQLIAFLARESLPDKSIKGGR